MYVGLNGKQGQISFSGSWMCSLSTAGPSPWDCRSSHGEQCSEAPADVVQVIMQKDAQLRLIFTELSASVSRTVLGLIEIFRQLPYLFFDHPHWRTVSMCRRIHTVKRITKAHQLGCFSSFTSSMSACVLRRTSLQQYHLRFHLRALFL